MRLRTMASSVFSTPVQAAKLNIEFDLEGVAMRGILVVAAQFNHKRTGGGQYGAVTEKLTGFALLTVSP